MREGDEARSSRRYLNVPRDARQEIHPFDTYSTPRSTGIAATKPINFNLKYLLRFVFFSLTNVVAFHDHLKCFK